MNTDGLESQDLRHHQQGKTVRGNVAHWVNADAVSGTIISTEDE